MTIDPLAEQNFRVQTRYLQDLRLDDVTFTAPLRPSQHLPFGTEPLESQRDVNEEHIHPAYSIEVFARIVTREGSENKPYLLFLQGGPGFEAPRVATSPLSPSWLGVATNHYRVVMLDQRGTGRSTPVSSSILSTGTAQQVAEYLTHLRADGIVRDAEALRKYLGVEKWSTLGQSFGGFTTLHYLCNFPQSLDRVFITGGLSAIGRRPEEVYAATYEKIRILSEKYYSRHPQHRKVVKQLVEIAQKGQIILSTSEVLSPTRLRSLGMLLGSNDGWFTLYSLLDLAQTTVLERKGQKAHPYSDAFIADLEAALPYTLRNPLYYVLHESSYADGFETNWAAERAMPKEFLEDETLLLGEHVFSQWLDTVPAFTPWKQVGQILAEHPWPKLYSQQALEESEARGACATYLRDAYVPFEFALETAQHIPGVELYVTSENEHNGLRATGGALLQHLFDLGHGKILR